MSQAHRTSLNHGAMRTSVFSSWRGAQLKSSISVKLTPPAAVTHILLRRAWEVPFSEDMDNCSPPPRHFGRQGGGDNQKRRCAPIKIENDHQMNY
jgi:hypothetical protein